MSPYVRLGIYVKLRIRTCRILASQVRKYVSRMKAINIFACLFNHHFYRRSHSKVFKERAPHVHQTTKNYLLILQRWCRLICTIFVNLSIFIGESLSKRLFLKCGAFLARISKILMRMERCGLAKRVVYCFGTKILARQNPILIDSKISSFRDFEAI